MRVYRITYTDNFLNPKKIYNIDIQASSQREAQHKFVLMGMSCCSIANVRRIK